jgi:hypothetical protein
VASGKQEKIKVNKKDSHNHDATCRIGIKEYMVQKFEVIEPKIDQQFLDLTEKLEKLEN